MVISGNQLKAQIVLAKTSIKAVASSAGINYNRLSECLNGWRDLTPTEFARVQQAIILLSKNQNRQASFQELAEAER